MAGWFQDLRYALRRLRREPTYAAFVALTLALGIGANVTVFSVVDGVLLRSLPFDQADRLIGVWGRFLPESGFDFPQFSLSQPEYFDYRTENRTMSDVGAWISSTATVGGAGEEPERVSAVVATPSLFAVLRARPLHGRVLNESDPPPGPSSVVVLSHALWTSRFGGREQAVGERLMVNGTSRLIVGVMPKDFDFPAGARLWVPLVITTSDINQRQSHSLNAVGRLKDGVQLETAREEMDVLMKGWRERFPKIHTGHFLYLNPLMDDVVGDVRPALKVVSAATGFLLLIVCANVASLALARAERRGRESAIRAALGSGRWRLVRLAAIENGLLAAVGGAIGVALAVVTVGWLRDTEGVGVPRLATIAVDFRVWLFAAGASLFAACLLGALPAMRATAVRLAPALRLDTRTSTAGRTWMRRSLVAAEVALAIVLVTGAALMVRSFSRLMAVDTGFSTSGVLLGTVSLPTPAYATDAHVEAFLTTALERVRALPGVTRASLATNLPVVGGIGVWDFQIEGRPTPGPGQPAWNAAPTFAAPGYFETVGMRLVRGRFFTTDDRFGSEPVALITQAFERKYFAGENAVERRIRVSGGPASKNAYARIVGVVADVRDQSLAVEPRPMYFMVHAQTPATIQGAMRQVTFALRTDADPQALATPLKSAIHAIDPAMPVSPIRTFEEGVARTLAQRRFTALLLAAFAVFGLGLGVLGVYGVLAYTVAERTQELGLRRALGAPAGRVLQLVLVQGLTPVAIGIVIGIGVTFSARSVLETQLFGISPTDVGTYASVAAGVLAAAVLACLVPARRALSVSPLVALRET